MYKVIRFFHDLQDGKEVNGRKSYHAYNVGDTYPRSGYKPAKKRIAELASNDNAQGVPLIELTEDDQSSQSEE